MSGRNTIDQAFANNSQLRKRIFDAIDATPQYAPLFEDIASYHLNAHGLNGSAHDEPASKKRKLPDGSSLPLAAPAQRGAGGQPREVILEARDISFSLPQRKKLHLGIAQYGTDINDAGTKFAIYTRNPATNEVDMEVPLDQVTYALRLPIPEKAAKQYNFVLLLKTSESSSNNTEAIIWAVNDGPLKSCHVPSHDLAKIAPGPDDILESALDYLLQKSGGTGLTLPTAEEFSSAKPESHRKGDKAYHVKAFRGSKDGYLFFLSNGIFFGFKKPLSFFAFEDVESISYTSVLQRTFNLNIVYRAASAADGLNGDAIQEVEFSMLDQADFPGIDTYVKRHGLQDASLAESRRAKKLAQGKGGAVVQNGDGGNAEGDEVDTRTELEKAQQQMDDEEDEEEEDYDPGSEGESEGSGGESDEDEYDREYERERKKMKGRDLVKEELGSEAEDVSVTEDEDGDEEGEEEEEEEEARGDEDEDDHYDEDEDNQHDEEDVPSHDKHTAVSGTSTAGPQAHGAAWGYEEGMPDPDDEDQL
ncbi:uncharacterized protein Z520_09898 [Fonsecaea multimorphosa CBS 102226]|uniref:Histone chaperone RTT106/FACT complex subunit SPT16-like middle domain-containing protein n=1 Tax=Fonsecaea multimorphosa CBS 102226 TaxID=1442371 RepID=A0A0D2JMI1_9EURO|nr:uncharacterized protein Z520_09898 [Fonsecaea multimorphosa CBS 102226]KIX94512.1 hypothetical protein Z520_09898 [Fonsecaea multimorphosa CBS 102226]OAL20090.1 hypothetical protein AYO22_09240 [Fonsecaea multimorphosa]